MTLTMALACAAMQLALAALAVTIGRVAAATRIVYEKLFVGSARWLAFQVTLLRRLTFNAR